jgi:FRG domain
MVDYVVNSLENAVDFVQNDCRGFFNRPVFRGQRNAEWPLRANLFRDNKRIPFSVTQDFLVWSRRSPLLSSFDDEVLLQVAQHYGMTTDLLDFTRNPLIACFFAFWDEGNEAEETTQDSAIFVVDAEMLDNIESLANESCLGPIADILGGYDGMYREGSATGLSRLDAQEGVFVRDAHGTLEAVLSSANDFLGVEYEGRFRRRLNYAKLIMRHASGDHRALAEKGVTKEGLFPKANLLEREFERYLREYSDPEMAARLMVGLNQWS